MGVLGRSWGALGLSWAFLEAKRAQPVSRRAYYNPRRWISKNLQKTMFLMVFVSYDRFLTAHPVYMRAPREHRNGFRRPYTRPRCLFRTSLSSLRFLELSWPCLNLSLGFIWELFGCFGGLLELCWAFLGPNSGLSWRVLGLLEALLACLRFHVGYYLPFCCSPRLLLAFSGCLLFFWGCLRAVWGSSWRLPGVLLGSWALLRAF